MKYNIAQVIGLNTDQEAAQAISQNRDSEIFLAVLTLSCDDAFTKGRQLLSEAADYYFEAEGSSAQKIETTFKETADKLKQFAAGYQLCVAAVSGKVFYFLSQGEMAVYLKRQGALSSISALGATGQLISGFLQDGDKLLLATASLTSFLGEDLSETLDLGTVEFEEEVSFKIAAKEAENENLAGLVIEIAEDEVAIPTLSETVEDEVAAGTAALTKEPFKAGLVLGGLLNKILPQGFNYVRSIFPKKGRTRLVLGVILIVIILMGVGFKYKSSKDAQRMLTFNQVLQGARDNFSSAQGLQGLNPQEAKSKLDSAKAGISKALSLNPKNKDALDLKNQIQLSEASILQQFSAVDFPLFLDLDLIKKNFHADKMSLNSGKVLILDPGTKTLISLDIAKKNNQILAGSDQLGDAVAASVNGGLAFVYSKDKGVVRIDVTNQKLVTVAKKDADLGAIADIYAFAGNVYLLDSANQKIWKYLPTSEGYSDKREYLSKDVKADFSNSLRVQIESSIYVLKKGGEILRFTKGNKDNFSLGGLDKGVKDPKSFFVSSDTDNLYLLDSGNSRLLTLTKTGQFKSQYQGDKFSQATDLVVDETGKKVYLLEGSKIYSTDLK